MVDPSRIQGFGRDELEEAPPQVSFWTSFSASVSDRIDDVHKAFGQVSDRVTEAIRGEQDGDSDEDEEGPDEMESASPRQRAEAQLLVTSFCTRYPAARVVPKLEEIEAVWLRCSVLQMGAVAGAFYDMLSFSNGDFDWRPRLRALYAIHFIHGEGKKGQAITQLLWRNAHGLLRHLATEVPQCREKAAEVSLFLSGEGIFQPLRPPAQLEATVMNVGTYEPSATHYTPAVPCAVAASVAPVRPAVPLAAFATPPPAAHTQPAVYTQAAFGGDLLGDSLDVGLAPAPVATSTASPLEVAVAPRPLAAPLEPLPAPTRAAAAVAQQQGVCLVDLLDPNAPFSGPEAAPRTGAFGDFDLFCGGAFSSAAAGPALLPPAASPPASPAASAPARGMASSVGTRCNFVPDDVWQMDTVTRSADPFAFVTDLTGIRNKGNPISKPN